VPNPFPIGGGKKEGRSMDTSSIGEKKGKEARSHIISRREKSGYYSPLLTDKKERPLQLSQARGIRQERGGNLCDHRLVGKGKGKKEKLTHLPPSPFSRSRPRKRKRGITPLSP